MSYFPIGDYLIERRGDAVELLAMNVDEIHSGLSVAVSATLPRSLAKVLGSALVQCAGADVDSAGESEQQWHERCLDPIWSAYPAKVPVLPSFAVPDGGRSEPEFRFFVFDERESVNRKCSISFSKVLGARWLRLPHMGLSGSTLHIGQAERFQLIGAALSVFAGEKPVLGQFHTVWIPGVSEIPAGGRP